MKKIILIIFISLLSNCQSKDIEGLTYVKGVAEKEKITWLLSSLNGKNLSSESKPSLSMQNGKASAFGGCNGGSGAVNISNSRIKFESFLVTDKACMSNGKEILHSESEYFQALHKVDTYTLNGETLILTGPSTKLEFRKRIPLKPSELQTTIWELNAIVDSGMAKSLYVNSKISVTMKENKISGNFGCGNFEGIVTVQENNFRVSEIKENIMGCKDSNINSQAKEFLTHLLVMHIYKIEENHLTLKNKDSSTWLMFISQ